MLYASEHPLVRPKVAELRDVQTRPPRFRELVREISTLLGYEALRDLPLAPRTIRTPLADAPGHDLAVSVGLVPILRAGLGMVDAFLTLVPAAEVWHLGLYRDEETLGRSSTTTACRPGRRQAAARSSAGCCSIRCLAPAARPSPPSTCCVELAAARSPTSG